MELLKTLSTPVFSPILSSEPDNPLLSTPWEPGHPQMDRGCSSCFTLPHSQAYTFPVTASTSPVSMQGEAAPVAAELWGEHTMVIAQAGTSGCGCGLDLSPGPQAR